MSTDHQWIQPEHPTFLFAQEDEAAGVRNFGIDSLHKIAHQVSAGHTLDEILATALSVISAVTGSESSFTYILHNGKFEPWIWKTPERVDLTLQRIHFAGELVRSLFEYEQIAGAVFAPLHREKQSAQDQHPPD